MKRNEGNPHKMIELKDIHYQPATSEPPNLRGINLHAVSGQPVIVGGASGSGKTTLLNHILQNQKGIRTAVLVNEFCEIGIDNDLIVTTSDVMVELNNGCICCSINGELLEAVENIIKKKKEIDYIILETTGLADPLPIAMTFIGSELKERTRLDSIVTVIDAENFTNTFLESEVCKSQLINGDILVINKCYSF